MTALCQESWNQKRIQEFKESRIQGVTELQNGRPHSGLWVRDPIGFRCDEQWIWFQDLFRAPSVFASWCTYQVGRGDLWLHPIRGIWIFRSTPYLTPLTPLAPNS